MYFYSKFIFIACVARAHTTAFVHCAKNLLVLCMLRDGTGPRIHISCTEGDFFQFQPNLKFNRITTDRQHSSAWFRLWNDRHQWAAPNSVHAHPSVGFCPLQCSLVSLSWSRPVTGCWGIFPDQSFLINFAGVLTWWPSLTIWFLVK